MINILEIWNNVWPYLVAVLLFLTLIIIHEFGHFIAAKLLGVRVNEFAVGFGPKLFSKKWGDTTYAVNLIPFGGYCAMEGEDENSTDDKAFCNKAAWRRFLIVIMGAVFNLILGLIIVAIILAPGKLFATTTIAAFEKDAVSNQKLEIDDTILAVDGRKIFSTYDLSYAFTNVDDGKIDITVLRDGKKVNLKDVTFKSDKAEGITYLMVDFQIYGQEKTVGSYIENTFKTSISYGAIIWRSLIDLISGKYGISAVSGPVGTAVAIGTAAKQSLINLLPIMALITINLGIFNLLPVPALDGGRLVFILFEMITGKPVPQKYESLVHGIGFVILLGFMLLITFKDIWSLIF